MPYTARFIFIPEYGHEAQVRQAVEERVPAFRTAGVRASVWQEVAGPDRSAVYGVINLDKLIDINETTTGEGAKAGDIMRERLTGHVREARTAYYELLLAAPRPASGTMPDPYINVVTRTSLPGKANELRRLCVERGRELESQGFSVNVQVEIAGLEAGSCEIAHFYSDLDELEARRAAGTDAARQKVQEQFASVIAGPASVRLLRNVVPTLTS